MHSRCHTDECRQCLREWWKRMQHPATKAQHFTDNHTASELSPAAQGQPIKRLSTHHSGIILKPEINLFMMICRFGKIFFCSYSSKILSLQFVEIMIPCISGILDIWNMYSEVFVPLGSFNITFFVGPNHLMIPWDVVDLVLRVCIGFPELPYKLGRLHSRKVSSFGPGTQDYRIRLFAAMFPFESGEYGHMSLSLSPAHSRGSHAPLWDVSLPPSSQDPLRCEAPSACLLVPPVGRPSVDGKSIPSYYDLVPSFLPWLLW